MYLFLYSLVPRYTKSLISFYFFLFRSLSDQNDVDNNNTGVEGGSMGTTTISNTVDEGETHVSYANKVDLGEIVTLIK